MSVITVSADAEFNFDGVKFTALASPARGASETAMWRVELPAEAQGQTHQLSREELFHALAGSALAVLGGQALLVGAGQTLVVPAGVDFSLRAGAHGFTAIAVAPAGVKARTAAHGEFQPPWTL